MIRRLVLQAGGPVAVSESAILVGVAPVLMFPSVYSPLGLAFLCVAWLIRLIVRRKVLRRTPADWPFLGLLLMTSVSLYPSVDLSLSQPKLYGLLLGAYLFSFLVQYLGTPQWYKSFAAILVIGGFGVASVGFVGTDWAEGKLLPLGQIYSRLPRLIGGVPTSFGTLEEGFHPNEIGGTLALLFPVALGLMIYASRPAVRIWVGMASLAMLITIILTASRSAFTGIAIATIFVIILRWSRLVYILPLAIVGITGFAWWIGFERFVELLIVMGMGNGSPAEGRQEVWSRSYWLIQNFALTGIGLNTFPKVVTLLFPYFQHDFGGWIPHAHNLFLQVALDLGVLGLLSFIALLAIAGVSLIRVGKGALSWEQGLVTGLAAGLFSHVIFGLTDAVAPGAKPGIFIWAMLGGAIALGITFQARIRMEASSQRTNVRPEDAEQATRPFDPIPVGAGPLQWAQWMLFTLASGLGMYVAITGMPRFP